MATVSAGKEGIEGEIGFTAVSASAGGNLNLGGFKPGASVKVQVAFKAGGGVTWKKLKLVTPVFELSVNHDIPGLIRTIVRLWNYTPPAGAPSKVGVEDPPGAEFKPNPSGGPDGKYYY